MELRLQHIMPLPLSEKLRGRPSGVWSQELRLAPGERVKLRAPSGSGKTTLIHIIWQLRRDYTGSVWYGSHPAEKLGAVQMAHQRQQVFSVVFQDLRLFGALTARENIELKRVMAPKPLYGPEKIDEMAERLGVQGVLHQPVHICSYGEQQRIAIIRALMQPFAWLLMDEPFSHLDAANTAKAAQLIQDECDMRGAGFLLTDLDEDDLFAYTQKLFL